MAEARKKLPKITSPRLSLKFPKIDKPDYGSKDYPKPDGEYATLAVGKLSDPNVKAFIAKLEPLYAEAKAAAEEEFKKLKIDTRKKLGAVKMNPLYTTVYDPETEEPTGEVQFKFSMKASGVSRKEKEQAALDGRQPKRWNRKPDVFDARGLPIRKVPEIWGGTIARVSFEAGPYFVPGTGAAGLKLALAGVQIIDLVQGGQRNAASHGFGEEDDGYAYEETSEDTAGAAEETENEEAGTDDGASEQDF